LFNDDYDDEDDDAGFKLPSKPAPPKISMPAPIQTAPPKAPPKAMFNTGDDEDEDEDFKPKANVKPLAMPLPKPPAPAVQ